MNQRGLRLLPNVQLHELCKNKSNDLTATLEVLGVTAGHLRYITMVQMWLHKHTFPNMLGILKQIHTFIPYTQFHPEFNNTNLNPIQNTQTCLAYINLFLLFQIKCKLILELNTG